MAWAYAFRSLASHHIAAIVATGPGSVQTLRGTASGSGGEHYRLSKTSSAYRG